MQTHGACVRRAAYSTAGQACLARFQATDLRGQLEAPAQLGALGCQATRALLRCASEPIDLACGTNATALVFAAHAPFAARFQPDCVLEREKLAPAVVECSREQRAAYYRCRERIQLDPVALVKSDDFNATCDQFADGAQRCFAATQCQPQPAHDAFNATLSYVCLSEGRRRDVAQFGPCLRRAAASEAGQQCAALLFAAPFAWDDASRTVCRRLNRAFQCAAPLLQKSCPPDATLFVYDTLSLLASRYGTGCSLDAPSDTPGVTTGSAISSRGGCCGQPLVLSSTTQPAVNYSRQERLDDQHTGCRDDNCSRDAEPTAPTPPLHPRHLFAHFPRALLPP